DGDLPSEAKLHRLDDARRSLDRVDDASPDPVLAALGHARRRFDLPLDAFGDLIDGVEMDVVGTRYERFEDLVRYCRRVAGSIGRLSVAVFEAREHDLAAVLADDLGVAMQLTNILRDVREDFGLGRVYLPREDLRAFGLDPAHRFIPERAPPARRGGGRRSRRTLGRPRVCRRRRPRDAARVPLPARRRDVLLPPRRAVGGQRPARVPTVLHGLPGIPGARRRERPNLPP